MGVLRWYLCHNGLQSMTQIVVRHQSLRPVVGSGENEVDTKSAKSNPLTQQHTLKSARILRRQSDHS